MTPETQLTILIPTRNRPAILQRTLNELMARGFGRHPLIVCDDASDDPRAVAEVVSTWPSGRLIRVETRAGQAKGRNLLMRNTESEYALFLDDDSWPEDRVTLLDAFNILRREQLSILTFQYHRLSDGGLSVPPEVERSAVCSFLGGASLFHLPSVLAVGGYRECFVYGYEEPELAFRLWLAGMKIEYLPVVIHHNQFHRPDERRDYREYDFLYARNGILISSLNMPLVLGLPHGLLRSLRRSLYLRRNFWAKARGTWAGIRTTFTRWSERKPCSFAQARAWLRYSSINAQPVSR